MPAAALASTYGGTLTISSYATNAVTLSWSTPTGSNCGWNLGIGTTWKLFRTTTASTSTSLGNAGVLVYTGFGTATSYTDTTITTGQTRYYALGCDDGSGLSNYAVTGATLWPDLTAPTQPGSFNATGGDDDVQLSWTAATDNVGVTTYRVYRGGTLIASPTGLSWDDATARNGNTYSYTVKAEDAAGNQSSAASASATAVEPTTCAARPSPYGGSDAVVSEVRALRRDLALDCKRAHADSGDVTSGVDGVRTAVVGVRSDVSALTSAVQGTTGPQALSTGTLTALHSDSNQLRFGLWFLAGFVAVGLVAPLIRKVWLP